MAALFLLFLHETGFSYFQDISPNPTQHQLSQLPDYFQGASQQPTKQSEGKSLLPIGMCLCDTPVPDRNPALPARITVAEPTPTLSSLLIYTQTTASHL